MFERPHQLATWCRMVTEYNCLALEKTALFKLINNTNILGVIVLY